MEPIKKIVLKYPGKNPPCKPPDEIISSHLYAFMEEMLEHHIFTTQLHGRSIVKEYCKRHSLPILTK